MIKLLTYPEINPRQWRSLIDQSPTTTWFQTPEAYEFYKSLPEEMTPFAVGVVEASPGDRLVGVVVGYITKERSKFKQHFTRRAIIIGGPLLADDISPEALSTLLSALKKFPSLQGGELPGLGSSKRSNSGERHYDPEKDGGGLTPIYIESRNFSDYSQWKSIFEANGFAYQPHLNFHVDCTQENMLTAMSESRRRQIKKAIKSGVEIVEAKSCDEVKEFYAILQDLYTNKVKTPLFPLDFFLKFYEQNCGKYLLVKYADKIIGGIMCPILKGQTIYEWFVCGMDEQYKNQYPSVMATYAAIEYAKQHGLSRFDFMGAGKPEEAYGVRDFKARFGGELVEHGRFLCVRKLLLHQIGKLGVKVLKKI